MEKRKESLDNIINNKLIKIVLQPIISLKSGIVLGYEALSRIICESEFEGPEALFAAAGEYNQLWDLELLCRTTALETAHKFILPPYNKKLFINVNPNIMHDNKFKKGFTSDYLSQYSISPKNIIFEITERNAIDDLIGFRSTISHYKNQDYEIAIDDVGAGYSGLNLISDVNPHYIKLDMKLIRNIDTDILKTALVKGMVEFSKASNNKIIAEGIETYEELETVIKLGVQYGQGYYIQKPNEKVIKINQDVIKSIQAINKRKNQTMKGSNYRPPVRNICKTMKTVSTDELTVTAYDIFKLDPNCSGLCIVDNNVPVGIITKEKLSFALSGQYGFILNHKKPISTIMDREFLLVECETPIEIVSSLAMERPNENLYDVIIVTEDNKYFGMVTVKDLMQELMRIQVLIAKQQNPLTGLPGNLLIEQKLQEYIYDGRKFTISYIDIDNFKPYNDIYSFESGDLVIKLLADILREHIPTDQFIGHIGGDDFIVILDDYKTEDYFKDIIEKFESEVLVFYDQTDIKNGYVTAKSRRGVVEKIPLITLTSVFITNESYNYKSTLEISSMLSGLKTNEKRLKAV